MDIHLLKSPKSGSSLNLIQFKPKTLVLAMGGAKGRGHSPLQA